MKVCRSSMMVRPHKINLQSIIVCIYLPKQGKAMKNLIKKIHHFDVHKHMSLVGLIGILIYMITQSLETLGVVNVCPFCQTIRVCIGLIGLLMILPFHHIYSKLCTVVIGFMGAHVAAAGLFINIQRDTFINEFTVLAAAALFILAAQVMIMLSFKSK